MICTKEKRSHANQGRLHDGDERGGKRIVSKNRGFKGQDCEMCGYRGGRHIPLSHQPLLGRSMYASSVFTAAPVSSLIFHRRLGKKSKKWLTTGEYLRFDATNSRLCFGGRFAYTVNKYLKRKKRYAKRHPGSCRQQKSELARRGKCPRIRLQDGFTF